jgi:hypothetical protein
MCYEHNVFNFDSPFDHVDMKAGVVSVSTTTRVNEQCQKSFIELEKQLSVCVCVCVNILEE